MRLSSVISEKIGDIRRWAKGEPQLLHTPFTDIVLVKGNRKKTSGLLAQLQRTTEALTENDIKQWRMAWQRAISVEFPSRQWLCDIYRDALIDAHLSGCIGQREGFVLSRSFNIEDKNGDTLITTLILCM